MIDDNSGEIKGDFTTDGIHLIDEAYQIWAKVISEYMK